MILRLAATGILWTLVVLGAAASISSGTIRVYAWEFAVLWLLGILFGVADAVVISRNVRDARRNGARYRRLFESGPQPAFVFMQDANGRFGPILEVNHAACELLGTKQTAIVARSARELFAEVGPELEKAVCDAVEKRERVAFETTVATAAGASIPVEAEFARFASDTGPAILALVGDLADTRRTERVLRRRTRQLTVLSSAANRLNEELDLDTIVEQLVQASLEAVSATGAVVGLVEGDEIVVTAWESVTRRFDERPRLKRGDGVAGHVWETMAPYMTNDAPRDPHLREHPYPHSTISLAAVPVIDRHGEFLGCVEVHDRADGRPFDDEDLVILSGLAASAANAIDNTRGVDQLLEARSELLADRKRLRSLAAELSRTSERERRTIAAELHDGIGQSLAMARMKLGQAAAEADVPRSVREARSLVEQAIADTRSLTFQLSPPLLYELGLGAAIEWLAEETEKRQGLTASCRIQALPQEMPDDLRALLYVCTRELVLNVVKHAEARRLEIDLSCGGGWIRLTVRDDGAGFDTNATASGSSTFGLFSVHERLGGFGGVLEVRSAPGRGTTAVIEVPFDVVPAMEDAS